LRGKSWTDRNAGRDIADVETDDVANVDIDVDEGVVGDGDALPLTSADSGSAESSCVMEWFIVEQSEDERKGAIPSEEPNLRTRLQKRRKGCRQ
jgi:hypothetical protein